VRRDWIGDPTGVSAVEKERVLVTVRTYPTPSARHIETVCIGGINDHREWRRLVPVPLRYLEETKRFRTYDVIEVKVGPGSDGRPETRRPQLPSLRVVGHIERWAARCEWIRPTIVGSVSALQGEQRTLGPVSVAEVVDFVAKRTAPDWTAAQREKLRQAQLFDNQKPLEKVPFEFRFRWRDGDGDEHDSQVLAWEMLETFRQYRRRYEDPLGAMRDKWLNDVCGPDRAVAFHMGNLAKRRSVFCVCGWFNPPKEVADGATLW
jgi:hypothetical protein